MDVYKGQLFSNLDPIFQLNTQSFYHQNNLIFCRVREYTSQYSFHFGDFIPDEIEDAADKVKAAAKEVKRRGKNVKKELKDVVEAAKELGNQVGDVGKAVKGKKRQGRKAKK